MSGRGDKTPRSKASPGARAADRNPRSVGVGASSGARTPRTLISPLGTLRADEHPRLSLRLADRQFCEDWLGDEHAADVLLFLHNFSKSTWSELRTQWTGSGHHRRRRYHSQSFDSIEQAAQERLSELGHAEVFEEFMRYRTDGTGRAWGFEVDGTFYLLWWDTGHAVYVPTKK